VGWIGPAARWTMRIAASAALVCVGIIAGRGMTVGSEIAHTIHETADIVHHGASR